MPTAAQARDTTDQSSIDQSYLVENYGVSRHQAQRLLATYGRDRADLRRLLGAAGRTQVHREADIDQSPADIAYG